MPTVIVIEGFRIRVNVRDEHPPPHVHVHYGRGEIRVKIFTDRLATFWDVKRPMKESEKMKALRLVRRFQAECLEMWEAIHGDIE